MINPNTVPQSAERSIATRETTRLEAIAGAFCSMERRRPDGFCEVTPNKTAYFLVGEEMYIIEYDKETLALRVAKCDSVPHAHAVLLLKATH